MYDDVVGRLVVDEEFVDAGVAGWGERDEVVEGDPSVTGSRCG